MFIKLTINNVQLTILVEQIACNKGNNVFPTEFIMSDESRPP